MREKLSSPAQISSRRWWGRGTTSPHAQKARLAFVHFYCHHWLFLINLVSAVTIALSLLAPYLMYMGITLPARWIYFGFSLVCHQTPSRSYFIFGYQMAFCQRYLAIYVGFLLAGLIFAPFRRRLRPLPWYLFLLYIGPMAVDGFTQFFGWRESTWELRTVTGLFFSIGVVWLIYPILERGLGEVHYLLHQRAERERAQEPGLSPNALGGPN